MSVFDQISAVCNSKRQFCVLFDNKNTRTRLADLAERLKQLLAEDRREPKGRLVKHQDRRIRHQRAPDRDHLLLPA